MCCATRNSAGVTGVTAVSGATGKLEGMRTDDGFVHAWTLPADIAEDAWRPMHADIVRVLSAASRELEQHRSSDDLAILRGPEGYGHLRIDPAEIAINGNAFLGQAAEKFAIERHARYGVIARVGSADSRRTVRRCDTKGLPYDLAVCAALLVVLRHMEDRVRIGTTGTIRSGWGRAAALVRTTIGDCGQLIQRESGTLRWTASSLGDQITERRRSGSSGL